MNRAAHATGKQARGPQRADAASAQSQFTLKLSAAQHRQLQVLAFEADMTMRGYVMNALANHGLTVTDEDLKDRRKR